MSEFSSRKDIEFYTLDAHIPQLHEKHYDSGLRKIEEAKNLFGPGIERSIGYSCIQGKPLPQRKIEWEFKSNEAAHYLNFILEQQPIPSFELPLFELIGSVYFYLIDHKGDVLPNQTNWSSLMI